MKSLSGILMPPQPCIPSMITAATSPALTSFSTDSMSFRSQKLTLWTELNGEMMFGLSVTATAPEVLPWKLLRKATTLSLPVWNEASLRAFSLDSAPELSRNRL